MARSVLRLKEHPPIEAVENDPELAVRVGTPADVHAMMALTLAACHENGFVEPNPVKLLEQLWAGLSLEDGIVGIIGQPGEPIEAAVLLRIGTPWYSHTRVIEEKAIFVSPDFRAAKGGRAKRLCEFSKELADALGLPLTIGVLSNARTEAKLRMYRRVMGEPAGAFWIYGARTGDFAP